MDVRSSTGQWTWVSGNQFVNGLASAGDYGTQGVSAVTNMPEGRQYATIWFDTSGNLWLFGGESYDAEGGWDVLNDLWEYTEYSGSGSAAAIKEIAGVSMAHKATARPAICRPQDGNENLHSA